MASKTSKKIKSIQPPRRSPVRKTVSSKPVFSVTTIVTALVFIAFIAGIFIINKQKENEAATSTPEPGDYGSVFDTLTLGNVSDLKIENSIGDATQIQRNGENVWALILPEKTEADQGQAEAAATQVGSLQIVDQIENVDPSNFGFDAPRYIITAIFDDGTPHVLEVGDASPTNTGYYVRLDNSSTILLVQLSGIDALTNLVLFPPYLNPPTATPLPPTETLVPSETAVPAEAEVTATPTP